MALHAGSDFGGCNIGFVAHDGSGNDYFITALHCVGWRASTGDLVKVDGEFVGGIEAVPDRWGSAVPLVDAEMDGDYVVVKLFDGIEATDEIHRIDGSVVSPSYSPSRGEGLIKEGDGTGVSTGPVVASDVSVVSPANLSDLGGTILLHNQVAVATDVWPGDSGGPVMKNVGGGQYRPVGIIHGGVPEFSMIATRTVHIAQKTGLTIGEPSPESQPPNGGEEPDDGEQPNGGEEPPQGGPETGPNFTRAGVAIAAGALSLVAGQHF